MTDLMKQNSKQNSNGRLGYKKKYYNRDNTCDRCREEKRITERSKLTCGNANKEKDKNGDWNERWLCNDCIRPLYYRKWYDNIKHNITKSRKGNLDPNCTKAKADKSQELTCRLFGVKDLNKENDNFNVPIDHSRHSKLGIIDTQCRFYSVKYKCWSFSELARYQNKKIDHVISYCISSDGQTIERIYIFPIKEIVNRTGINILKYDKTGNLYIYGWYEKYKIIDEEFVKKANEIWRDIING